MMVYANAVIQFQDIIMAIISACTLEGHLLRHLLRHLPCMWIDC